MDSVGYAVLGGLAGGLVFLMIVMGGNAVGMTRMNFLKILGSMMAPKSSGKSASTIGFAIHMTLSAGFGVAHGFILQKIGVTTVAAGAGWGAVLGAAHGMMILAVMPVMLSKMHPLIQQGAIEQPGVALTGFGSMTPVGSLMAHVGFGVTVGAIYVAGLLQ